MLFRRTSRPSAAPAFRFIDPGPLVDNELSLIPPSREHAAGFLRSIADPQCQSEPACRVSATALETYLDTIPNGRERCDPASGCVAAYRMWMRLKPTVGTGKGGRITMIEPPMDYAGTVTLRIGNGENIVRYLGHVGYVVFPPARGRHLAERSVRLLLPLAKAHSMPELWITCNPDNEPSRRTCERLGAEMVDIVDVPRHHPLYARGDHQKCRYRLTL